MQNQDRVLTVKELTRYLKMRIDGDSLLQNAWVRGEISNFTHHSSGHMYFTLKDADSRIKCVMFASHNQRLAFIPKNGSKVMALGNVSVYERDGQYQFYALQMEPDGIGSLYLAFEQLKKKLEAEGLFDQQRKRKLPKFPRTVGVITSATGAAVRDVVITLQRRYPSVGILLYPVQVQGKSAAPSIVKALAMMNKLAEADVLIVGRGGGSLEELWAFNEEAVARSIASSTIPVISAVGHETDYTIADFVADIRAATPTAAAEVAVPHHLELRQHLQQLKIRLLQGMGGQLGQKRDRLKRLQTSPYLFQPERHIIQRTERLDRITEQLVHRIRGRLYGARQKTSGRERSLNRFNPQEQLGLTKNRLETRQLRLKQAVIGLNKDLRQHVVAQIRQLDALSPLKVMQRGYSLVYLDENAALVKSKHQLKLGDRLRVRLHDGTIRCEVLDMKEENGDGEGA